MPKYGPRVYKTCAQITAEQAQAKCAQVRAIAEIEAAYAEYAPAQVFHADKMRACEIPFNLAVSV